MKSIPALYSYVVDHDTGYAPNPSFGSCILSHCKFDKSGRRKNLLESVSEGDWIVGTGGTGAKTAPGDRIVYAMRVEKNCRLKGFSPIADFSQKPSTILEAK